MNPSLPVPDDLVVMGYISGSFGVRGWVNVVADTEEHGGLLQYPQWWLAFPGGNWRCFALEQGDAHPKKLAAKLVGIEDREAAFALKGAQVAVPRSVLPVAAADEYYWADLIGLTVFNQKDECLGVVERLFETGANDVLVVRDEKQERLLPFVKHVVLAVDLPARRISVDWELDY